MATISESSRTPQPSSRVPSITAPSWRDATDSTRNYVNYRDGGKCWLCGTAAAGLMHVVHQISASQTHLFVSMRENGTVFPSLTHLAHHRNLILLCPTCHQAYNASPMLWCMLPSDDVLEKFISHERRNYQERQAIAASSGLSPPRQTLESDPSFDITTVTYRTYFFEKGFRLRLAITYYAHPEERRWQGDPTAAIHKAFQGAFVPWRMEEIDIPVLGRTALIGMPEKTEYLLSELSVLWSRPHPVGQGSGPLGAIGTPIGSRNDGGGGGGNVQPKDPRDGNDRKSRSAHHSSSAFDQKVSGTRSQNEGMDVEDRFSHSPSLSKASIASVPSIHMPPADRWLFGPQYSATDIIKCAGRTEEAA